MPSPIIFFSALGTCDGVNGNIVKEEQSHRVAYILVAILLLTKMPYIPNKGRLSYKAQSSRILSEALMTTCKTATIPGL